MKLGDLSQLIATAKKKDHLGLSKVDRKAISEWKKKNPKFNENNVPQKLMNKLIWMQLGAVRKENGYTQNVLADAANVNR